jgi:glycosyltransferase involved in cell wall biosynthesis
MIEHQIDISVIIPTYNRSDTISNSIKSVLNQTYKAKEIIVIDDCSTDNTQEILNSFSNLEILRTEKNVGAQAARNIGIKAARYNWIAFLDSDDEWLNNKLEKQVSLLNSINYEQFAVIHGDCLTNDLQTKEKKEWNLHHIEGENVYKLMLSKSGTFFPAILTSKEALKTIGFLDEKVIAFQEWDTAIRLSKICTFKHIRSPLFQYNIRSDSISINSKNSINGYFYIIQKYKKETIKQCGIQTYYDHILKCANMAMNSKRFEWGRKLLSEVPISVNKVILNLLSYLRIRPKFLFKPLRFLPWKK